VGPRGGAREVLLPVVYGLTALTRGRGVWCGVMCRDHGPREFAEDLGLSEDASFVLNMPWLHEWGDEVTYIGKLSALPHGRRMIATHPVLHT
jgi:hypothetical protein